MASPSPAPSLLPPAAPWTPWAPGPGSSAAAVSPLVLVALAVGVGTALLVAWRARATRAPRDVVLLAGLCAAGKTALLGKIRDHHVHPTCPSMEVNHYVLTSGSHRGSRGGKAPATATGSSSIDGGLRLVDAPGHAKLRFLTSPYMPRVRRLCFVVDSTRVAQDAHAMAEYLYDLLTHPRLLAASAVSRAGRAAAPVPVVIVCNKQDRLSSQDGRRILSLLEKQLHEIRQTRAASLAGLTAMDTLLPTDGGDGDGDGDGDDGSGNGVGGAGARVLGDMAAPFQFSQLEDRYAVRVVECSAVRDKGDKLLAKLLS
ncbi:hypothetical protein CXG81DRAFT_28501 [Caulochytrium protostelioides]|uniref:Signal recognition particle receptor subunit beta n=1 Tax=Caulochytrium protostelioides TaxID=1555241 RepID=A0A4P9X128_9FUNG|nr:hypothetical protein CXG81DRAFT_28501 [Caulochytrium protostelioides]|eukprot:RKO98695.1 hypothetical protein CXG81DRAFT_28501 [Caulochytrium protostelioides]